MAINFTLFKMLVEDPEESWEGRSWHGWTPEAEAERLWENNRGIWRFAASQAEEERIATLSWQGKVVVVAAITEIEEVGPEFQEKGSRRALQGFVLPEGHPVREALRGHGLPRRRNPVTYYDTSELDEILAAETEHNSARHPFLLPPIHDGEPDKNMAGRIRGNLTVTEVPAEQTRAEIVHRAETAAMETTRTERQLEDRLREALYVGLRLAIQPAGSSTTLYTDVWDPDERELFEVKSSASRQSIRMAVGQLLDYRRYIDGDEPKCVVVVPEDPGEDLRQFVLGVGMDLMFWDEEKHLMRVSSHEGTTSRP